MEYTIAPSEIIRRKKAYIALTISLLIGIGFGSFLFHFSIPFFGYALVGLAMICLGAFSFHFFRHIQTMRVVLGDETIDRIIDGYRETYRLKDLCRVEIKWKINKTIRELYLYFRDNKKLFLTALAYPEQFKDALGEKFDESVAVREIHEKIDFDHISFYPILGITVGILSVWGFSFLVGLSHQQIQFGGFIFALYLLFLALYFFYHNSNCSSFWKTHEMVRLFFRIRDDYFCYHAIHYFDFEMNSSIKKV